jgi:hypothetical protein
MASVPIEPPEEVLNGCDWDWQDATLTRPAPAGLIDAAQSVRWQQVVAKSWSDPAFKQRLLNDPVETLRAEGLEMPEGRQLKVVEQTDTLDFLILPA